jgi:hypothetical protein
MDTPRSRILESEEEIMSENSANNPEAKVREIRRKTRRQYSAEEKIRIVLEGLKGEESNRLGGPQG